METVTQEKEQLVVLDRKEQLHTKRGYWILRRGQDILFSLIALLILCPIMLIVALVVFIDDPHGSPFFAQTRCGRDGKLFKMYKFRSMYVDAEERLKDLLKDNEMDGPAFKMKDDPRITRVGGFIRKTSLDELPQLWNVLRGDMSLVGPRPIIPSESELISRRACLGAYRVKPGISGLSQVRGRDLLNDEEKARLDGEYACRLSPYRDAIILLQTAFAVILHLGIREGAAAPVGQTPHGEEGGRTFV